MIVRGSRELKAAFHKLKSGDIFIGRVAGRHLKDALWLDLSRRGIHCLPAPLAQKLSNSRTAQAFILNKFMLPHTHVIERRAALMEAINVYHRQGVTTIITKQEHMHCGVGVRFWNDPEMLYNVLALDDRAYPFVMQPFVADFIDVRVIVVADYVEAYARHNKDNFRQNLAAGGVVEPYKLSSDEIRFCRDVMARGQFPYAHIDLMVTKDKKCYLSEIALNGGIKGALIDRDALETKKQNRLENMASEIKGGHFEPDHAR